MELNLGFWALQTAAMMLTAFLLPGLTVSGPIPAFLTVVALALVNAQLWDAALFFHIPDSLTSQAALLLLANGVIFWIVVKLLPGIAIRGVLPAIAAPIVFTVLSVLIDRYQNEVDWQALYDRARTEIGTIREEVRPGSEQSRPDDPGPRSFLGKRPAMTII